VSAPPVAIAVVNYNGREDTLRCLASLARATYPNRWIVLVDNGSDEPIEDDVRRRHPEVVFLRHPRNLGFTGGHNAAARHALAAGAAYVLHLNNDTEVEPDFLEPLVAEMERDPRVGMATPKILYLQAPGRIWALGARLCRWTGRSPHAGVDEPDRGVYDALRTVPRITGCAMLVRREVYERVGFLDDRFFIYEEELDWCLRARRAGFILRVVPQSVIRHLGHRDAGRQGRPFMAYLQTRNHYLMIRKNAEWFHAAAVPALAWWVISAARAAVRSAPAVRRAVLRGMRDALAGRYGPPEALS
jgi:GT2 family glycosyltransferase